MLALLRAHGFTKHLRTPGMNKRIAACNSPLVAVWWPGLAEHVDGHGDLRHRSEQVPPQLVVFDVVSSDAASKVE
jgi:hypothetical protein